jgi:hypothetical protein
MNKKAAAGKGRTIVKNLLITLVAGLLYYYWKFPAINLQDPSFFLFLFLLVALYCVLAIKSLGGMGSQFNAANIASINSRDIFRFIKKSCAVPALIGAGLAVFFAIGGLISAPIFRAHAYEDLLQVVEGDFAAEVAEISYNQIPMLDEASAKQLGDRKMGELSDIVSQYLVADEYTQINYHGRPVRVTALKYADLIKWLTNSGKRGLPAYFVIDMATQNVEVVRQDEGNGMKYSTAEHLNRYLYRYLRFKYPTYMFATANFEINEDGVPYWVCPRVVKRIGLFGGMDIDGAVLVNASTGEATYYASDEVPTWVDRVYDADLIVKQYNYHGMYVNGWFNSLLGQRDVTVTTRGYNYIVIGDDVYMYTGITSIGSDQSNIGFILTNQRTKETKYYQIAGATETSAMASAEGVVQQMKYVATFPLLLNIESQPTYFMALKDSAGLVKMYAMVNVEQYQIVAYGTSVAESQNNYLEMLYRNNLVSKEVLTTTDVKGKVAELRTAVLDGNTMVFIRLEGDDFYYVISVADSELAVIISVGDEVTLKSTATEGEIRPAQDLSR